MQVIIKLLLLLHESHDQSGAEWRVLTKGCEYRRSESLRLVVNLSEFCSNVPLLITDTFYYFFLPDNDINI